MDLHRKRVGFLIPNPWDVGSAKLLSRTGWVQALATSSGGLSLTHGGGAVSRDMMMDHIRAIAAATDLPISADLENGFGDEPQVVAETIRMAAEAGAVGGSIEDADPEGTKALYPLGKAVERIRAAAEAKKALGIDFVVIARTENFLIDKNPQLSETISRLQAYAAAGADCVYAPGLQNLEQVEQLMQALPQDLPMNVMLTPSLMDIDGLRRLGVARVSIGSRLAKAAYARLLQPKEDVLLASMFHDAKDFR